MPSSGMGMTGNCFILPEEQECGISNSEKTAIFLIFIVSLS